MTLTRVVSADLGGVQVVWTNLGAFLGGQKKWKEAEAVFKEQLEVQSKGGTVQNDDTRGTVAKLYAMMLQQVNAERCCLHSHSILAAAPRARSLHCVVALTMRCVPRHAGPGETSGGITGRRKVWHEQQNLGGGEAHVC